MPEPVEIQGLILEPFIFFYTLTIKGEKHDRFHQEKPTSIV